MWPRTFLVPKTAAKQRGSEEFLFIAAMDSMHRDGFPSDIRSRNGKYSSNSNSNSNSNSDDDDHSYHNCMTN